MIGNRGRAKPKQGKQGASGNVKHPGQMQDEGGAALESSPVPVKCETSAAVNAFNFAVERERNSSAELSEASDIDKHKKETNFMKPAQRRKAKGNQAAQVADLNDRLTMLRRDYFNARVALLPHVERIERELGYIPGPAPAYSPEFANASTLELYKLMATCVASFGERFTVSSERDSGLSAGSGAADGAADDNGGDDDDDEDDDDDDDDDDDSKEPLPKVARRDLTQQPKQAEHEPEQQQPKHQQRGRGAPAHTASIGLQAAETSDQGAGPQQPKHQQQQPERKRKREHEEQQQQQQQLTTPAPKAVKYMRWAKFQLLVLYRLCTRLRPLGAPQAEDARQEQHDWARIKLALRFCLTQAAKVQRSRWSLAVQRDIANHVAAAGGRIDACNWNPQLVKAKAEKVLGYKFIADARTQQHVIRAPAFHETLVSKGMAFTEGDVRLCDQVVELAIADLPNDQGSVFDFQ